MAEISGQRRAGSPALNVALLSNLASSLLSFRGDLIRSLLAKGCRVTVVAPLDRAKVPDELAAQGARFVEAKMDRTRWNMWRDFGLLVRLIGVLRSCKPDLLLTYTPKCVILGSLAGYVSRTPHICSNITGLGYTRKLLADPNTNLIGTCVKLAFRAAFSCNSAVIFQNPEDESLLRALKIVPPQILSARVAGSGVDLDLFRHVPPTDLAPRYLMVARLLKSKGVIEYLKAASCLKRVHTRTSFRLVGPLESHPDAVPASTLKEYLEAGHVEYTGHVVDVRPELINSRVFVLPSYYGEGVPRSLLEAAAIGRAIVTTDHPGCRQAVPAGANGILVKPRSTTELIGALERFCTFPELIRTMGLESRALAESRFDVKLVTDAILATLARLPRLSQLLNRSREPSCCG